MKKVIFVVVAFSLLGISCNTNPANSSAGEDTQKNVKVVNGFIQISTFEELCKIGRDPAYPLNAWMEDYTPMADFYGYELTRDIDASASREMNDGRGFEPIGFGVGDENVFFAIFDGKGYKIKNLYINRPDDDGVGLFGNTMLARIRNITLEAAAITGRDHVGGIVGRTLGLTQMINCSVTGTVMGKDAVGGLAGWTGNGSSGPIDRSDVNSEDYGYAVILRCYSDVAVEGNGHGVGGLVGWSGINIYDSYAKGTVTGRSAVGGMVGRLGGRVVDCFAATMLNGESKLGGLAGELGNQWVTLSNSYWDRDISKVDVFAGGRQDYALFSVEDVHAEAWGKTTVEMKRPDTYKDWDFIKTWQMGDGVDYPALHVFADGGHGQ